MLHLHCTAKLAKTLRVSLQPAPDENSLDWLDCWYIRDIPLNLPLDALLFTNSATNYSLVHPFDRRESIDEVVLVFQQRLAWLTGKPLPAAPEPYQTCKTTSKRLLGCMNELVESIYLKAEDQLAQEGVQFEKIEDHLNHGISGGLFPLKEFRKRLDEDPPPNTNLSGVPHLRLVED
jgi:hypothetical protein